MNHCISLVLHVSKPEANYWNMNDIRVKEAYTYTCMLLSLFLFIELFIASFLFSPSPFCQSSFSGEWTVCKRYLSTWNTKTKTYHCSRLYDYDINLFFPVYSHSMWNINMWQSLATISFQSHTKSNCLTREETKDRGNMTSHII